MKPLSTLPCLALILFTAVFPVSSGAVENSARTVTSDLSLTGDTELREALIIRGNHITIDARAAHLIGPGTTGDVKSLEDAGIGVLLENCENVTIRGLKVSGFATGLLAKNCRGLVLEDCDFSDNYHNPGHGWGELPARGGIRFENTRDCVVLRCKANRVWDGLHLLNSDGNLLEDNDFSHCSNTCAKLWTSSRNRFLNNNLSYGIRIDRAAGEVHARDSTGVLIESGSDENYWFRNDITQGGDGIFIRVLNGWVSRGNIFIENDTSYANNNCVESWSPGNTYIRNKANHGSYGFWLGGSDQTVLIGNEAAFNGLPDGNHNAPESFGHGGIVIVNGPCSHAVLSGNYCHDNNGGGIVFRGDEGSQGGKWKTRHWVIQQNRLEGNRWPVWGRWADNIWLSNNTTDHNREPAFLQDITGLEQRHDAFVLLAPSAVLDGPERAVLGQPVRFDASTSRDGAGRDLHFHWSSGDDLPPGSEAIYSPVFTKPGLHRICLTVDNGTLADIAWRDLFVTLPAGGEMGTEGQAAQWGHEVEGAKGAYRFADDPVAVCGQTSLRLTADPYPGGAATANFPRDLNADFDFSKKHRLRFWFKAVNPNSGGFQNAGPIVTLHTPAGPLTLQPAGGANLFSNPPESEGRWSWNLLEIPLAGGEGWEIVPPAISAAEPAPHPPDLSHVTGFSITQDSWGGDPFTFWLDGLTAVD